MTPKQFLLAHLREMHGRLPRGVAHMTYAELQREHGRQHHRLYCNHYHAGPNTGADNRPAGWYTGEDAVVRS